MFVRRPEYDLAKKLIRRQRLRLYAILLVYQAVIIWVFHPIVMWIWKKAWDLSPVNYITHNHMIRIISSPSVILAIVMIGICACIWGFFRICLVLHGLDAIFCSRRVKFTELFCLSGMDLIRALHPRNCLLILLAGIFMPFFNIYSVLNYVSQLVVPRYLWQTIRENQIVFAVLTVLILILLFLMLWSMLVFPYFVLEKATFFQAMKRSISFVRKQCWTIGVETCVWKMTKFLKYIVITGVTILFYVRLTFHIGAEKTNLVLAGRYMMKLIRLPIWSTILDVLFIIAVLAFYVACYLKDGSVVLHMKPVESPWTRWTRWMGVKNHRLRKSVFYRRVATMVLAVIVFFASMIVMPDILQSYVASTIRRQPELTCHRGYSFLAPENTLPAFEAAIEAGVPYVELDVQLTKDGVVMVTHDANLKRCTGKDEYIYNMTYDEVRQLDAGAYFGQAYAGTKIPTLVEVLQLCDGKIKLNIEIKQKGHAPLLEEETVRLIKRYSSIENCSISSMNYESLQQVKQIDPDIETGYILVKGIGNYYDLPDVDYFSVDNTFITSGIVSAIHKRQKKIWAWTVDTKADAIRMLDVGVDNIITDRPELIRYVMQQDRQRMMQSSEKN